MLEQADIANIWISPQQKVISEITHDITFQNMVMKSKLKCAFNSDWKILVNITLRLWGLRCTVQPKYKDAGTSWYCQYKKISPQQKKIVHTRYDIKYHWYNQYLNTIAGFSIHNIIFQSLVVANRLNFQMLQLLHKDRNYQTLMLNLLKCKVVGQ